MNGNLFLTIIVIVWPDIYELKNKTGHIKALDKITHDTSFNSNNIKVLIWGFCCTEGKEDQNYFVHFYFVI